MPPMKVTLYTPQQVAKLAQCTVQTVYRHIEEGHFPSARVIGKRKWFLSEPDVIEYIGYDPNEIEIEIAK